MESHQTSGRTPATITDDVILDIAERVLDEKYNDLGTELGFSLAEIGSIKQSHEMDVERATIELLLAWRSDNGSGADALRELRAILISAGLGALATFGSLSKPDHEVSFEDFLTKEVTEGVTVRALRNDLIEHYLQESLIHVHPWHNKPVPVLYPKISVYRKQYGEGCGEVKVPIEGSVSGIFSTRIDGQRPRRILFFGEAGYGKTTTVTKIVQDWAAQTMDNPLRKAPLLFFLKLRETDRLDDLGSTILNQLLGPDYPVTSEQLEKFISENDKECCIILDGFDEAPARVLGHSPKSSLDEIIMCIRFKGCSLLITTRPHKGRDFYTGDLQNAYTKMELDGYSLTDAEDFIRRYYHGDMNTATDLVSFVQRRSNLMDLLIHVPFFCLIFCCIWSKGLLRNTHSVTDIMANIVTYLAQRTTGSDVQEQSTRQYSKENMDSVVNAVGKVVMKGLVKDKTKFVFAPDDFKDCPQELELCIQIGLMSRRTSTFNQNPNRSAVSGRPSRTFIEFYHKLAMEHCAGVYLSSLPDEDLAGVLQELNTKEKTLGLGNVLVFAAGSSIDIVPIIRHIVSFRWNTYEDGSFCSSCCILLKIIGEAPVVDEESLTEVLRSHFSRGSLNIDNISGGIFRGLVRIPASIKPLIHQILITNTHLGTELTSRLWQILSSFKYLTQFTIWDSNLRVVPGSPSLPKVTTLYIRHLNSDSFYGMVSSMSGVSQFHVDLMRPDSELSEVARSLRGSGSGVTSIWLKAMYAPEREVSVETMTKLSDVIRHTTTSLEEILLMFLNIDEGSLADLVDACRSIKTIKRIKLYDCDVSQGGRLETHLSSLDQVQGAVEVDVRLSRKLWWLYRIPHVS